MNLFFYLFSYDRKTEELLKKEPLSLSDDAVRGALGLPPKADLAGDFPVGAAAAARLRKLGLTLDLRTGNYFLGSEAALEDVLAAAKKASLTKRRSARPAPAKKARPASRRLAMSRCQRHWLCRRVSRQHHPVARPPSRQRSRHRRAAHLLA